MRVFRARRAFWPELLGSLVPRPEAFITHHASGLARGGVWASMPQDFKAVLIAPEGSYCRLLVEAPEEASASELLACLSHVCAQAPDSTPIVLELPSPTSPLGHATRQVGFTVIGDSISLYQEPRAYKGSELLNRGLSLIECVHEERLEHALDLTGAASLDWPELQPFDTPRAALDRLAHHRDTWSVLVDSEGTTAGALLLGRCEDAALLQYVGVTPSLRGTGIGEALVRVALHRAAHQGAATIRVAVDARNGPALRLYERLGFRRYASVCLAVLACDR